AADLDDRADAFDVGRADARAGDDDFLDGRILGRGRASDEDAAEQAGGKQRGPEGRARSTQVRHIYPPGFSSFSGVMPVAVRHDPDGGRCEVAAPGPAASDAEGGKAQ